jgi:hypothetical protein
MRAADQPTPLSHKLWSSLVAACLLACLFGLGIAGCSVVPIGWHRDHLQAELGDWDFAEFMSNHLGEYLIMSKEFMDEYYLQQGQ